jgi:RNA polymerase sigma-70 factor (ECF subfamily)
MGRLNDIALVTQVAVFHNKRAFDQLVREYQSPIRRFFLTQTGGDSQLSDDLAQETFIKAYTSISQFHGTSSFLTWLTRIAYNVHYDYRRSEKRKIQGDDFSAVMPDSPMHNRGLSEGGMTAVSSSLYTQHSSLSTDLHQALSVLREEEQTCITLQLIEGYAINEISDITGMTQNTVKSHLRRGKEKLANYLRENGYDR